MLYDCTTILSSGKTRAKMDIVLSLSFELACSHLSGSRADKQGVQSLTPGLLRSDSIMALLGCFSAKPTTKKKERKEGTWTSLLSSVSILQVCIMTFTNAAHVFLSQRSLE